jgi:hypothetical protein
MKELRKRWRLLAFVALGLVVALLLSLSPVAWATPGQDALRQTVVGKDGEVCDPLESDDVVFTFTFTNGEEDWTNVEFTDEMHPVLTVNNVSWECERGGVQVDCPDDTSWDSLPGETPVVVTMGASPSYELPADTTVTITIECTCSEHGEIENIGTVEFTSTYGTYTREARWTGVVDPCEEFVPEAGSLLLLGSGMAGVAGYAGMKWRGRKR